LRAREPTVKGTGLTTSPGKEDPVELDSILKWKIGIGGVAYGGGQPQVKYPNSDH